MSLTVFSHVLDLDLSFHLSRKTGEVTKVVDRGTAAIQNVLSTILFQIAPQVRWAAVLDFSVPVCCFLGCCFDLFCVLTHGSSVAAVLADLSPTSHLNS